MGKGIEMYNTANQNGFIGSSTSQTNAKSPNLAWKISESASSGTYKTKIVDGIEVYEYSSSVNVGALSDLHKDAQTAEQRQIDDDINSALYGDILGR